MHGHLQDLQEANETASTKLEQAEKMIASLRNENNVLQTSNENSLEDLVKQNSLLKEQVRTGSAEFCYMAIYKIYQNTVVVWHLYNLVLQHLHLSMSRLGDGVM